MQPKRLYRSKSNRVLGGVCGGLGEYLGIDPIIFRVLFLFISPLFWIYFILWIFVPENPNQRTSAKGTAFWKILLIILFFIAPIIFFLLGGFALWKTAPPQSSLVKNNNLSSADLTKDATSKMQEAIQLQNKGNLTDIENQRKISLISEALSEYKQATEKDPSNTDAWQSLAVINQKLGDALGNSQSPDQITFYNESARAYYNLGKVYLQKGSKDQAKEALQTALKIVPSSNTEFKNNIQEVLKGI